MPTDEENFDVRNPPWMEQEPEMFPASELLDESGGGQEMLEAPEPDQDLWRRFFDWQAGRQGKPEGEAGVPDATRPATAPQPGLRGEALQRASRAAIRRQPMSHAQRQIARQESRQQQEGDREVQQAIDEEMQNLGVGGGQEMGRVTDKRHVPRNWKPPIANVQEAMDFVSSPEDEVALGEDRTIGRESPEVQMDEQVSLASVADQNATLTETQSHYLHNAMSRLRDAEIGFMSRNYV